MQYLIKISLFLLSSKESSRYPERASNTCCQGLVEFGFLISGILFLSHIFIQSGIRRFFDQSPPPITLPALAVQILSDLFFLSILKFSKSFLSSRATSTPAKALMSVRHKNLPGVLSHVFEVISHAGVNVEEMENMMYDGARAACARIQLDVMPSKEQIETIVSNENILSITITPMNVKGA